MKFNIVLGVEALARGCHKLKSFNSTGCLHITDKAISCLAQYCHALQVVNLKGCIVSISLYLPPPIPRQARFPLSPPLTPSHAYYLFHLPSSYEFVTFINISYFILVLTHNSFLTWWKSTKVYFACSLTDRVEKVNVSVLFKITWAFWNNWSDLLFSWYIWLKGFNVWDFVDLTAYKRPPFETNHNCSRPM